MSENTGPPPSGTPFCLGRVYTPAHYELLEENTEFIHAFIHLCHVSDGRMHVAVLFPWGEHTKLISEAAFS